ncbi:hypothetical protein ACHAWF_006640 [Thalassiosira exigua]
MCEVEELLPRLATSIPKNKKDDPCFNSLVAELQKESNKFRSESDKLMKKARRLKEQRAQDQHMLNSEEAEEMDDSSDIDAQIAALTARAKEIWNQCKEHSEASNYGHYLQLQVGLTDFYAALSKYLAQESKRPRGMLEYVLNNAIEHIGGGEFMAEHSGYEQTNGRALNSLSKFDKIAEVCKSAYPVEHPLHNSISEIFDSYADLARKLFRLCRLMKSQKRIDTDEFDEALLDFILGWNTQFPGTPYFNKLHFVMVHLPDFISEYGICGRASAESHESVHARFSRLKQLVKRMVSVPQRYKTLFARSTMNLTDGVADVELQVKDKMTGNERGEYNTDRLTKMKDEVELSSSIFSGEDIVGGEPFLTIVGGGRIHKKFREDYLLVKSGRAPTAWGKCFVDSNLFSAAKLEHASHTTY